MEKNHIFNEAEKKELWDEYFAIADKVRELQGRQSEIDHLMCQNACNVVASRFIPLELYDKIRVVRKTWVWDGYKYETVEGFFGLFRREGHIYTADDGVGGVKLRLYQIKKDGTPSQRYDEIYGGSIESIEKVEE